MSFPLAAALQATPAMTDELRLIEQAVDDPEAFRPLYEHHAPAVYRYLRARVSTAEDAADLTQQVFLQSFRGLPRYRAKDGGFAPWLFRIARNAAIDSHRRHRPAVPLERFVLERASPVADPEDARLDWLRSALTGLDADKRDLLALRFAGSLSSREIATVVGKSEAAVHKQPTRIIQRLKEQHDAELR